MGTNRSRENQPEPEIHKVRIPREIIHAQTPKPVTDRNNSKEQDLAAARRELKPKRSLHHLPKEQQIRLIQDNKAFVEQSIMVGEQLQRALRSLKKNKLLDTSEFSVMKRQNVGVLKRQKARYASIANKEKRMKSKSNLLRYSEVFQQKDRFNQRIQSIHNVATQL